MARAKRTDRTEARRRYRAELATATAADAGATDADTDVGEAPAKTAAPAAASAPRPGIGSAFRGAMRPLDIRGDIASLPVTLRQWAVPVAFAAAIVSTVVFIVSTNDLASSLDFTLSNPLSGKTMPAATSVSYLALSLFVAPPPAAGGFLIGFFAKRASWLAGLLFGVVAAALYTVMISSPAGKLLTGNNPTDAYILQAWVSGPIGAALFAAAAAWYRRFLDLANPNRNNPNNRRQAAKPTQGRGQLGSQKRR